MKSNIGLFSNSKFYYLFRNKLYINAGYLLGVNIIPAIAGVVFWSISARLVATKDIGIASAFFSAASLVVLIANMGLSTSLIRFLPEISDRPDFLNSIFSISFCTSLLFSLVFLAGIPIWATSFLGVDNKVLFSLIFIFLVLSMAIGGLLRDTFVAYREAQYAFLYTSLVQAARIILLILFGTIGYFGLIGSTALAFIFAIFISLFILLLKIEPGYYFALVTKIPQARKFIQYSVANQITNVLIAIPQLLFPLIILDKLGPESNAYAYIALMIGIAITTPSMALANSALVESSHETKKALAILWRTGGIGISLSVIIGALTLIFSDFILSFWGPQYAHNSITLLRLLAFAAPFISFNQAYINFLRVFKKIKTMVFFIGILTVLILIAVYILIPIFGIDACGYSILGANVIFVFVSLFLIKNNERE